MNMESITAKEGSWGVRWQWDLKADENHLAEVFLDPDYTDLLHATTYFDSMDSG